jgi:hypothetical protein
MLLVMNTTGLFDGDQPLTVITKDRIHSFLPGLWEEVFKMSTPPLSVPIVNNETNVKPITTVEENVPLNESVAASSMSENNNETAPANNTRVVTSQIQNL